jgi:hypothetical protein
MTVSEVVEKLQGFNPKAKVGVIAHNKVEQFSLTWAGTDGSTKEDAFQVNFYVDKLCEDEVTEEIEG